ncbi:hypothetical protein [Streptacidiphilus jiangxiensis]|uniref:Uncharacterized protein n=1 Tax=Streptacidiphilus jiangxiensis TaxID=235985 RepID=A0A1H8B4P3_STRJI|nr:hypothetical protein [Streptacidiphilus jiangxiensis]SEM77716.1 hypothetical protein SAMN05414137_1578 [Streptacidiphilus jiangxiensis]
MLPDSSSPSPDLPSLQDLPLHSNGHLGLAGEGSLVTVLRAGGEERIMGVRHSCAVCGESPQLEVTADAVEVTNACLYPDGITTETTLNVPSGKIVITDDLRGVYGWDLETIGDYNTAAGQDRAIRSLAAAGCAFGPVGNSCPGLYRTGPDTYVIATPGYDEDEGDEQLAGAERIAGIVTDLWAYSIADVDDFTARGGSVADLGWTADVVDITPGTYQVIHHTGEAGFDHDAPGALVFAHIQRIA